MRDGAATVMHVLTCRTADAKRLYVHEAWGAHKGACMYREVPGCAV
jgi:hypothetical protein